MAWPGGKITSNKEEALKKFLERKAKVGTSGMSAHQLEALQRACPDEAKSLPVGATTEKQQPKRSNSMPSQLGKRGRNRSRSRSQSNGRSGGGGGGSGGGGGGKKGGSAGSAQPGMMRKRLVLTSKKTAAQQQQGGGGGGGKAKKAKKQKSANSSLSAKLSMSLEDLVKTS